MIETVMTNFGITKYLGDCLADAIDVAKRTGFECNVLRDGQLVAFYSPIGGVKFYN